MIFQSLASPIARSGVMLLLGAVAVRVRAAARP